MNNLKRTYKQGGVTKRSRTTTVLGYNRSAGGLTASSRMKSALARMVAASKESGYVDLASASYALDTTGTITLLNTVPQGAAVTQRVGKKIQLKSLQFRGAMQNGSAAAGNDVAFMIVYDKRPTGALPSITDVLNSVAPTAMNNDANAGRFRILKRVDEVLIGNLTAAANYTEAAIKSCDYWLSLKGLATTYKAAGTGAIADIEEGALYMITVGGTAAGTSAASLFGAFRLRFLDV